MKFFDSHCHLQFEAFDGLTESIVSDMIKSDSKAIIVGSSIESSKEGVLLSKKYPQCLYSSVGVHPVHSLDFEIYKDGSERKISVEYPQDLNKLRKLIDDNVKAIGECGIDFSYLRGLNGNDEQIAEWKEKQINRFQFQINLAKEFNLPLILHIRKEYMMGLDILNQMDFKGKVLFHFFKGKYSDFEEILKYSNCYFSFSNIVTYDNSMDKVLKDMPLDRFMIETDAPYVSPIGKKGEINEPKNVFYVAEKISKVKDMNIEDVLDISYDNAMKFFNI